MADDKAPKPFTLGPLLTSKPAKAADVEAADADAEVAVADADADAEVAVVDADADAEVAVVDADADAQVVAVAADDAAGAEVATDAALTPGEHIAEAAADVEDAAAHDAAAAAEHAAAAAEPDAEDAAAHEVAAAAHESEADAHAEAAAEHVAAAAPDLDDTTHLDDTTDLDDAPAPAPVKPAPAAPINLTAPRYEVPVYDGPMDLRGASRFGALFAVCSVLGLVIFGYLVGVMVADSHDAIVQANEDQMPVSEAAPGDAPTAEPAEPPDAPQAPLPIDSETPPTPE